ncbi:protein-glutamate O-methyltransferase CheR [Methyloligella sp. 2.7D]|uniref:CheR family methyltransferase n=1 Tax=unclassified Methyloligella TaxID=2625955 RepID=UPI00157C950B|nr:protein-glutamate O-methyltransferase CheR [Methyloligella sp. GL2]QKP76924.1 protein-glutamate O-methyltransferase CheR [Methyloligella sp. GL2]
MNAKQFEFLRHILKQYSGIALSADKQELMELRVEKLLKEQRISSVAELCEALSRQDGESLRWRLAELMAIQETYFFRDKTVFSCFTDTILPALIERRASTRHLRIWCAAAATGQEPYSIAMALAEMRAKLTGWKVDILATDFSEEALMKARSGVYRQFEVQRGLPVTLLLKYFGRNGNDWEIRPEIRQAVSFRQQNLLHNSMRHGMFDLIFCRNVMIYFDQETRAEVLGRLTQQLSNDGFLVLGATETVRGMSEELGPLPTPCPGVYQHLPYQTGMGEEELGYLGPEPQGRLMRRPAVKRRYI